VNDYYQKMKGFANSLFDLGIDIPDHILVLNILCGLNENYDHLHVIFIHVTPFPLLKKVHDDLCLEEIQQGIKELQDTAAAPTAFYATSKLPTAPSSSGG
jgi:hypothetical protein